MNRNYWHHLAEMVGIIRTVISMNSCFAIFRTLAHYRNKLDIESPFKDNLRDIHFLSRIETGGAQATLFENTGVELKVYYSNFKEFPGIMRKMRM